MVVFNEEVRKQLIEFLIKRISLNPWDNYNHYEGEYGENYEDEDWYEDFREKNGADGYAYGASKIVLFYDDLQDWVIKIPMFGDYYEEDDCYKEFEEANSYYPVAKNDYCAAEAYLTEQAINIGVGHMIAKTYFLADFNGVPVYVAENIPEDFWSGGGVWKDKVQSTNLAKDVKTCYSSELQNCCIDDLAIARFIDCYGDNDTLELISFISQYNINDLHNGNIHFTEDGIIKLIDYSGYRS